MTEWRFYPEGETPHVSTVAFHAGRERAPHLEQEAHRPRLELARDFILQAAAEMGQIATVADLGCGDGGLLSLLKDEPTVQAWGYDFQPSNVPGWSERRVAARHVDVFGAGRHEVVPGNITVCTEVLEHLADPHDAVSWIAGMSDYLVASSPWTENDVSHDACHAWAWDQEGYRALLEGGGFEVIRHETTGIFQVILGRLIR